MTYVNNTLNDAQYYSFKRVSATRKVPHNFFCFQITYQVQLSICQNTLFFFKYTVTCNPKRYQQENILEGYRIYYLHVWSNLILFCTFLSSKM